MLTLSKPDSSIERTPRLLSYSRAIAPINLLEFLRAAPPETQRVYWENKDNEIALAGWGVTAQITASGANRFAEIKAQADAIFANAIVEGSESAVTPRLFGGFSFQPDYQPNGVWQAFAPAYFVLPRYTLTRSGDAHYLTINAYVMPGEESKLSQELAWMIQQLDQLRRERFTSEYARTWMHNPSIRYPMSREDWRTRITEATQRMRRGELDKVVLARTSEVAFNDPIDPLYALENLRERYHDCYRFLIEPAHGHAFFGATPEILAQVDGTHLHTAALAGSIRRGANDLEDDALAESLWNNPKERHEHALVVNALYERLTPLTRTLSAPDVPQLYRLSNIQHLYTPFEGTLPDGAHILNIIEQLHPTPALGGYPRNIALEAIKQAEIESRGWYAAPVGWFDHMGSGQFAVAIRSAVAVENTARLYAGVGVVAQSDPDQEWDETNLKFRPVLNALGVTA